jgi:hypothetical protein
MKWQSLVRFAICQVAVAASVTLLWLGHVESGLCAVIGAGVITGTWRGIEKASAPNEKGAT